MQTIGGREPLRGELGRFYDAIENPRKTRGELPILRDDELRAYLAEVRERTLEVLDEVELGADAEDPLLRDGFVYEMLLAHEHQHNETMLQLLQMVDGYEPRRGRLRPAAEPVADGPGDGRGRGRRARDRRAAGRASPTTTSAPATRSSSAPFEIDRTPVTNARLRRVPRGDRRRAADVLGARRRGRLGAHGDGPARAGRPGAARHPRLLARGRRLRPLGRQAAADRAGVGGGRAPRRLDGASARGLGVDARSDFRRLSRASRRSPTPSTRRSSSATSYKVLRGGSWATHAAASIRPASATGTCRSAARSSPASAARGTPDDDREPQIDDRGPPRRRRPRRRWRATSAAA